MKNLIISLLVTVFATSAFAHSIDTTLVIARADGHFAGLTTVALLADGRLQMVDKEGLSKQVTLNDKAFKKITHDLRKVANVEIKNVVKEFVCMTLVPVIPDTLERLSVAGFDYQVSSFVGSPRLILTARGCYYGSETYPELAHAQASAVAAREQLVILALANLD